MGLAMSRQMRERAISRGEAHKGELSGNSSGFSESQASASGKRHLPGMLRAQSPTSLVEEIGHLRRQAAKPGANTDGGSGLYNLSDATVARARSSSPTSGMNR